MNFYTFRYIYFALYNLQEWSSENKFQTHFISKIQDCCNRCNNVCLFILLYFVFVILSFVSILGIIIPIAVFMVRAPVNEGAIQGVTFIYSIVAAVLGALITIEIGWKSLSPPFSINDVLKRNMSRMKINPCDTNDRKWKKYSEEQRMSKVVDNLIKYGHVYSAVALNHSSPQVQEAQNNHVYAGLIENVTGAPVNMHHSWPFTFRSIQSTTIDGFRRPKAITIIPRGDVLVLERDGKCVSRIIANERVQLPHGNVCQLQWPTGIAAYQQVQGGQVYIFVVDRRNQSVEKCELNQNMNELTYRGTTQAVVNVYGVQNGAGSVFKSPVGIAVHPRTHRVYVGDTGNHRIQILDGNLNFIGNFGGRGQFKRPQDISFADDGNNVTMYVADHGNNRIQVFTANDIVYSGPGGGGHKYKQQEQAGPFLQYRVIDFQNVHRQENYLKEH